MTPHMISTLMRWTRCDAASINPVTAIAPANAARTMANDPRCNPAPKEKIMTRATASLEPEEIPRIKGPAIGLLKNV